jgi:hypothetical protein
MGVKRKERISIPVELTAQVMYESDRTCCVCTERGKRVQIHHIDENPANNDPANLAVLCFDCHDQTQIKGGFGRRLDAPQVREFRERWIQRVDTRRKDADELASMRSLGPADSSRPMVPLTVNAPAAAAETLPEDVGDVAAAGEVDDLTEYIARLPQLRAQAMAQARPGWDSGATADMMAASYQVIDTYVGVMAHLARWYPERHFGRSAETFFSRRVSSLFRWHRRRLETGPPPHGTILGPLAAGAVMRDTATMIVDLVDALQSLETPAREWDRWRLAWERAGD